MTNRELVLNMLAELTTKGLSENSDPQTIEQHTEVAIKGATAARNACLEIEEVLGEKKWSLHSMPNQYKKKS